MNFRSVCDRMFFLASLTIWACILVPSATAQKISETLLVSGIFNINYDGFDGAFNSKGQEFFTFDSPSCQGLNFYKGGEVSVVETAPALAPAFCPSGIVADSADNFWFVDLGNQAVGFMSTKGIITEYPAPNSGIYCNAVGCTTLQGGITLGSDGAMWVSSKVIVSINQGIRNYEFQVARVASDGTYTYYTISELFNPETGPSIATGSDGAVYVQDSEHITKVTPAGQITVYNTASSCTNNPPVWLHSLTVGPDGNMWFISNCSATYPSNNIIGNITPSGAITTFPLSTLAQGLASGSDGAIWFTTASYNIGRITTSGTVTYTAIPTNKLSEYTYGCVGTPDYSSLTTIIRGPKGTLQFVGMTDVSGGTYNCTYVGSFTPTAPAADRQPGAISARPDSREAPATEIQCGPGGADKCELQSLEGSFPWGKSAYNGIATETVTYSYVDTPQVMIQLQEGPQFGLCDVTNGNGQYVTMPTTFRVVGEKTPPGFEPELIEGWVFPVLSAQATGAAKGEYYTCTFSFVLMQKLSGGTPAPLYSAEFHKSGHVGP